ncbi:hypothetical protein JO379_006485 [Streptomyces syringium]|uniref:Uncharacterized protein n=1 Tax=Streptomyces syringium TaxID=76729 RepID=A0ABS4YE38_9ACTN|nr:hypothetical protein [Streptomyces syringium]
MTTSTYLRPTGWGRVFGSVCEQPVGERRRPEPARGRRMGFEHQNQVCAVRHPPRTAAPELAAEIPPEDA